MFIDRVEAGKRLAKALAKYKGEPVVIYALPRGGVVPAVEVARALGAPLDLIVVRKIGHPMQPEYAVGAVSEDGDVVMNPAEASTLDREWIAEAAKAELHEARRRRDKFLRGHPPAPVEGKTAIVVDDGLATGLTMEAAIRQLRKRRPAKVVIAVPVAAADTAERLRAQVDELVVLHAPQLFGAVGAFYRDFDQVSDEEVVALMRENPAQSP